MTKYVLNSGGIKRHHDLKRKFHREIVKGLSDKPKFLLCNFAQGREYWEPKFAGYSDSISEDMPDGVKPTFELAAPDKFVQQCKNADVIYFHGGDCDLLFYWMRKFDYLSLIKDKVVATNSASSCMVASSYYTCDWRECQDGFGILPIKFIPHYDSDFGNDDPRGPIDWEKAKRELEDYGDKTLPVHALEEGEFIEYTIS
jgi:hypothetical protein